MAKAMVQKQKFSIAINTEQYKKLINNTLGDPERAKRFIGAITSAVAVNPALQECEAGTILAGALLGESLNLSPSPQLGQYYLIPFDCKLRGKDGKPIYQTDENGQKVTDDKGKWIAVTEKRAQFCLGYKGYIQLALHSGQYTSLNVVAVKEGELQSWNPFTEKLECDWNITEERDKLKSIGYAARLKCIYGFEKIIYWSKEKMLAHADTFSPAFSAETMKQIENGQVPDNEMWKYSSFWYKSFDDMAKKTMLRQLLGKWGDLSSSPELCSAYSNDYKQITVDENGNFTNADAPLIDNSQIVPEAAAVTQKVSLDEI